MKARERKWCIDVIELALNGELTAKRVANLIINCAEAWRKEAIAFDAASKEPKDVSPMVRFAWHKLKESK